MKKRLILYYGADEDESDHDIARHFHLLINFAEMLGQDHPYQLYADRGKPQDELQKAIDECRETGNYLLCYDLNSLCPDKQQALDIIDALSEEMLFVMFVDDESTLKTIQG